MYIYEESLYEHPPVFAWLSSGTPVEAKYERESIAKWAFVGGEVVSQATA